MYKSLQLCGKGNRSTRGSEARELRREGSEAGRAKAKREREREEGREMFGSEGASDCAVWLGVVVALWMERLWIWPV